MKLIDKQIANKIYDLDQEEMRSGTWPNGAWAIRDKFLLRKIVMHLDIVASSNGHGWLGRYYESLRQLQYPKEVII